MAGYNGYSKSNNAVEAESDYRYPKSVLARRLGLSAAKIERLLDRCEWHHSSKYFNEVDYYDARDAIRSRMLSQLSRPKPSAEQLARRDAVRKVLMDELKRERYYACLERRQGRKRRAELKILLASGRFRPLAIAGQRARRRTMPVSTAVSAVSYLMRLGSRFPAALPSYMIPHYTAHCPALYRHCCEAADYLKEHNHGPQ